MRITIYLIKVKYFNFTNCLKARILIAKPLSNIRLVISCICRVMVVGIEYMGIYNVPIKFKRDVLKEIHGVGDVAQ